MKKVECIIRPSKLEDLVVEVEKLGINGLNITQIAGYGKQKGKQEVYRGVEYEVKLKEKLKVEMVVQADQVDELIDIITDASRTGEVGDGKIFVYSIDQAVRIRTGEEDEKAV
ncbi:P-II family nitrogen regulator [Halanaerobacter jeridensis]|uniref:Nitrogen regulatory protein P-II 1 n=1 Tax=Halanaerobacter jeridensis TaxID=706427 RepID=A0A939BQN4_9FIRM|nr:P-II family nitrogen regulator [Halanaerobacter jeridensis]MBM7556524.1 nitrogen regulatory protein P-II 1 [Halanaerobacter jeridensis]